MPLPWHIMQSQLEREVESGATSGQIASRLTAMFRVRVSRNAVIGRASRTGLQLYGRRDPVARSKAKPKPPPPSIPQPRRVRMKPPDEPKPRGKRNTFSEGCQWIHGDPLKRGWRCCAHPTHERSPWCAHHVARVWREVPLIDVEKAA